MEKKLLLIGTVIALVLAITITATGIYTNQPNEITNDKCGCTGNCKCLETQETCTCNQPSGCDCKNGCHA